MNVGSGDDLKKFSIYAIPPDSFFSDTVYIDSQFILMAPEMPFTDKLKETVREWGFNEIMSSGDVLDDYAADKVEDFSAPAQATINSDSEKIKKAEDFYNDFLIFVETLFFKAATKNELDKNSITETVKSACEIIRDDRRYLLRILRNVTADPDANYLVSHVVKSTIIAIIIGAYLKLPHHRMIELGVSAVLHEIGMIKLPPQIYLTKRPLALQERKAMMTHPILGFNLLRSFDFPLNITMGALEHHERENGTGYPQKLTGDKISLYSKIIAVSCSYEALSSQRPHKEAKDGYTGMLELLKNEGKQYDDTIIRALVYSLSIYPIGLYVLLSSGRKGQVVDVNPEYPRYPIVQVFRELTPDGKNKILETSQDGLHIVRPLRRDETGSML